MSKVTILAVLATMAVLLAVASAYRPGNRVFIEHEVKKVPQHWIPMPAVAHPNKMFNLIFAIKQRNLDKLTRIFESVSDPKSSNYGNYLTIDQITAIVEPAPETISTIVGWLATHGLTDYTLSANRDMIFVDAPLQVASRMFDVQFQSFIHRRTGKIHTTTKEAYSAPAEVAQLLDFVVGFNGFPSEPRKLAKTQPAPAGDGGFQVGPHELRQRYNVTQILAAHPNNKQAVAEFQGEYYSQSDLQTFMKKYYPSNTNPAWWTATVKGTNTPSNPSTEGSLDIEYIMGPGIPTSYYSMANFDFYSDLTRWIAEIAGDSQAPWVHSVSYGSQGNYPTKSYQDRFDVELQKVGLRGISIIFASGDSGAGCFICENLDPSFPAVSQYVTSVGATQFMQYGVGPEQSTDPVWQFGSGGGFSWNDGIPAYQKNQVAGYFAKAQSLPASSMFNKNGRATPDVAALGIGYTVLQGGGWTSVGGTSASAPTFAAIISLLNNDRLNSGKPTLGFLNPWIYQTATQNPGAFFDVTVGSNPYSCCSGFSCATGYDPVTGMGTPNYNKLRTLLPQ